MFLVKKVREFLVHGLFYVAENFVLLINRFGRIKCNDICSFQLLYFDFNYYISHQKLCCLRPITPIVMSANYGSYDL